MAQLNKTDQSSAMNLAFADNNTRDITPSRQRTISQNTIDSMLSLENSTEQEVSSDVNFTGGLTQSGINLLLDNIVNVNTLADLPTPVASVITLLANTTYIITGTIALAGNRIVLASNTQLRGIDSQNSILEYTGSGNLFTATLNFAIHDLKVTATTAAKIFALTGGLYESAFITNFVVNGCVNMGTVASWYSFFWQGGAVVSNTGTTGLVFSGTCNILIVELCEWITWATNGIAIDLGASTFNTCSFVRCGFTGYSTGQTGIKIAASSANINSGKIGRVQDSVFASSLTNAVQNLAAGDLRWTAHDNSGLLSTVKQAQGYIVGSALNTTFAGTGAGNEVLVNFGAAFLADIQNKFTISTAGRITYTGVFSTSIYFTANLYSIVAGGAARTYIFYLAKNGTIITSSGSKEQFDGSSPANVSVASLTQMQNGDYLELKVMAVTATTSLNVDTASIKVLGL